MKTFPIQDIRSWNPCYDPNRYLPEDWKGTALDILNHVDIPDKDKLWVVLREVCIDADTLHRFACWNASVALFLSGWNDTRSWNAIKTKLDFLDGKINESDLSDAESAAWSAVWITTESATESAARRAADSAAESANEVVGIDIESDTQNVQVEKLKQMLEGTYRFGMSEFLNL